MVGVEPGLLLLTPTFLQRDVLGKYHHHHLLLPFQSHRAKQGSKLQAGIHSHVWLSEVCANTTLNTGLSVDVNSNKWVEQ